MNSKKTGDINTTIKMPREKHAQLKKYCIDKGITMTDFFIKCVDKALKEAEKGNKK